jgi:anti-sigma factor RsiW
MNNDPLYHRLRELSWRRELTRAEQAELQAWLAAHPEAQADWAAETGLNEALRQLPDAPVPSNFTARVLQAVEQDAALEQRRQGRGLGMWAWAPRWLSRAAYATVLLGLGLVSYHAGATARQRQLAASLETVARVSAAPSPAILEDFDAIRALPVSPPPDVELLALLQ